MLPIHHTSGRWMPSFPLSRHRMFDHGASDDLLSLLPLVSPIVSLRVLIRSCCLSLRKKQGIPLMTEHQLSLLPFYAGWGIYNQRLVAAIAPLTGDQLALIKTPQHWSIGIYPTVIVASFGLSFPARVG